MSAGVYVTEKPPTDLHRAGFAFVQLRILLWNEQVQGCWQFLLGHAVLLELLLDLLQ
jgi:hypothetical protein